MTKKHLVAALAGIGLAVAGLWLYSRTSAPEAPTTAQTGQAETATQPPKPSSTRGQRPELAATRKATDKDVPRTTEEAVARPEYKLNQSMADLRQDFAAGRYDKVITAAKDLLAANPELPKVRAYLTMSACASQNESLAKEHFEKLPDEGRKFVATRCSRSGIELR